MTHREDNELLDRAQAHIEYMKASHDATAVLAFVILCLLLYVGLSLGPIL